MSDQAITDLHNIWLKHFYETNASENFVHHAHATIRELNSTTAQLPRGFSNQRLSTFSQNDILVVTPKWLRQPTP